MPRGKSAHGIKYLPIGGQERKRLGMNATLVRGDEVRSRHFPGPNGIDDLIDFCDRGGWKIRSLSTPHSIYRDLQGTREALQSRRNNERSGFDAGRDRTGSETTVEAYMLAPPKRLDLIEGRTA